VLTYKTLCRGWCAEGGLVGLQRKWGFPLCWQTVFTQAACKDHLSEELVCSREQDYHVIHFWVVVPTALKKKKNQNKKSVFFLTKNLS